MRKALLFIVAVAFIAGGIYLLTRTFSHPNFYTIFRTAGIAVIFIALGGYLLWDDFLRDRLRSRRR